MERELISWLRGRLPSHPRLRLGPGDDAAVLRLADAPECTLTVDMLTDHVDFELSAIDPRRAGRKALAVNLSDLAAMASKPLAAVTALALPRRNGLELAQALCEGMLPLAEEYDLALAGGDVNSWDGPLVISITLIGGVTARGPLRRAGARPGDRIVVTGAFGGSILGRHLDFKPRVGEALALHAKYDLHAGIDVSDGLSLDLSRLCDESGCGAILDAEAIPIAADARRLGEQRGDGVSPLEHALGDGEDFELILAVPPADARRMTAERLVDVPLTDVGEFVAERGLWLRDRGGLRPLTPRGWVHE